MGIGGVGKYFVGKVGWEREDMVSADLNNKDELSGVETRHKCVLLQLLTASFGDGGSCECRHTQAPSAHRHMCNTLIPPYYSNIHMKVKTAKQECCSDRPVFPQCEV